MSKINTEFSLSDSIDRLENKIRHFQSNQGYNPKIILKYQEQLGKMFNQKAEQDLQSNKFESCYQYLQKAQQLSLFIPSLKFQTLNNLALYHQQLDQPKIALYYLNQVMKMQNFFSQQNNDYLASTYLNISAIQSSLDCHDEALYNLFFSIILLQHELLIESLKYNLEMQKQSNNNQFQSNLLHQYGPKMNEYLKIDRAQVLTAAYHNLSLQLDQNKKIDESKKMIESAYQLSQYILPSPHPFRQKMKDLVEQQQTHTIRKHKSISFDDKIANTRKPHYFRQHSKQYTQCNPLTRLQNTPPKLQQHQKWITEINRSSLKLSQVRNIKTVSCTLNLE